MSHLAAQRAVVRMLHDPEFSARVRQDPDGELEGVPPVVRRQLAALDPRTLGLDRLRRQRLVRVLCEELKASSTLALVETRKLAFLERFFSTPHFHHAVEKGESLTLAFGAFLGAAGLETPILGDVVRLELALAEARRSAGRKPSSRLPIDGLRLAPGVVPVRATRGALTAVQHVEQYQFELSLMPVAAVCEDAPRLDVAGLERETEPLHLLAVVHAGELSLVDVDAAMHALLLRLPLRHSTLSSAEQSIAASLVDDDIVESFAWRNA